MATIQLEDISVRRGDDVVLRGVDLVVAHGELLTLVGSSGSGKTSLLRVVAGLDPLASGRILIDGVEVTQRARPDVAMVFQDSVLFPNLTVRRNVAFPLEIRKLPPSEIRDRVSAEGRVLHIEELMSRHPNELSAGHRQLVQIARALVRAPQVFLMDEPLARLDPRLRVEMRGELKLLQRGYGVTTLYVTNDPVEAMSVADRVAVLEGGTLAQVAVPEVVYHQPATERIAALMGELALLEVRVEADTRGSWLVHPEFRLRAWAPAVREYAGGVLRMGMRPDYLEIGDPVDAVMRVRDVENRGSSQLVRGTLGADVVAMRLRRPLGRRGDRIGVRLARYLLFDPVTGVAVGG